MPSASSVAAVNADVACPDGNALVRGRWSPYGSGPAGALGGRMRRKASLIETVRQRRLGAQGGGDAHTDRRITTPGGT